MNILIAGGSGLIGRALTEALLDKKHAVSILTRNVEKTTKTLAIDSQNLTLVEWDGTEKGAWMETLGEYEVIINLAGLGIADKRWSKKRKQKLLSSRIETTDALTQLALNMSTPPKVFIQSSAVGYYQDSSSHDDMSHEDDQPGDGFLANLCVEWENCISTLRNSDIRTAIIRTGIVLSNDGGAFPKLKLPLKLFLPFSKLGSGKQIFPWIHMDDEVNAILFIMENDNATGPFNLVAPEVVNNKEFTKKLAKKMGRWTFLRTPGFLLKLRFGAMSSSILKGQNASPSKIENLGFQFQFPTVNQAVEELLS